MGQDTVSTDTADDLSSQSDGLSPRPAIVVLAAPVGAGTLLAPPITLGRVLLGDERVSQAHARIEWERGAWKVTDLESRNGTFLDGMRVTGVQTRRADMILRAGHSVFALLVDGRGHPMRATDPVVGPELERAYDQIRAHAGDPTLLLHGESGAGKELAAKLFHASGPRKDGPFVAVNCAAIPEGVAERLLFGAKRGAFSGAVDAAGHFQMAHGGTLFLDEIADLEPSVQAKVLRVIETREVQPVGSTATTRVDVGIVAASHRELRAAVAERRFREDLYYRISGATIHLPPLRARKVDIARLVEREVALFDAAFTAHAKLIEACCVRPWPGNIRELRAAVRQAAVSARTAGRRVVRVEDLAATAGIAISRTTSPDLPRTTTPVQLDRAAIVAALAEANGVLSVAARALGLHRTQLYRLLERHDIPRDELG